ncbi:MAG: glycerol-3-phosphate dehydrogenase/oxidase [Dehalococcoidia bacterium]
MKRFIESHNNATYDIIVIGGGITGAAVAYEAASRGLSVAMVEKGDFGAATSSATSKLIHGGLRYLANFEIGIVRESLRERRILENIAPNFVYPIPFIVPTYKNSKDNQWILEPAMIIYDLLSYDKGFTWDRAKRIPQHRHLSRNRVLDLEPVVKAERLTGGIMFYDCASIIPERLTLAFIKSAVKFGAVVSNYSKVEDFTRETGKITGVVVRDLLNGKTVEIRGKMTINCAGPWADLVLDVAGGKPGSQHVRRSEGIHVITRSLTRKYVVGALTPNGRHCNILPWRGHSLLGTTDREFTGNPDDYRVTREKIEEFIGEINMSFGDSELVKYSDIKYAYGGLRPLVEDETVDVYKTSRKYEIYDNADDGLQGLITVEGGKYTTSRNLAENVLKTVMNKFGREYKKSITARNYLAGCDIKDMAAFIYSAKISSSDFSETAVDYLARIYGSEFNDVMQIARSDRKYAEPLNADGELPAQALYAVKNEMARTLTDIVLRRTGIGTLGNPGPKVLETVAGIAAGELKWDAARVDSELEKAAKALSVPK